MYARASHEIARPSVMQQSSSEGTTCQSACMPQSAISMVGRLDRLSCCRESPFAHGDFRIMKLRMQESHGASQSSPCSYKLMAWSE